MLINRIEFLSIFSCLSLEHARIFVRVWLGLMCSEQNRFGYIYVTSVEIKSD